MITNINPSTHTSFTSLDVTTSLIFGEDIELVDSCEDLQVHHDALYAILRYNDSIITSIDNIEYEYTPHDGPLCFGIDLCAGESSPVHVTIHLGSQTIIRNFIQFQVDKFLYKCFLGYNQELISVVLQHSCYNTEMFRITNIQALHMNTADQHFIHFGEGGISHP